MQLVWAESGLEFLVQLTKNDWGPWYALAVLEGYRDRSMASMMTCLCKTACKKWWGEKKQDSGW